MLFSTYSTGSVSRIEGRILKSMMDDLGVQAEGFA